MSAYKQQLQYQKDFLTAIQKQHIEWFHGTTLANALSIQQNGFSPSLSGTQGGANLGTAFYISNSFEYASRFTVPNASTYQHGVKPPGAILLLRLKSLNNIVFDTYDEHFNRMQDTKNQYSHLKSSITTINYIQHWAMQNSVNAYGHMLFPRNNSYIKMAVYNISIVEIVSIIPV